MPYKRTIGQPTKAALGLGNVDNTSDANKPVSTATQAALDAKLSRWTLPTGALSQAFPRNQPTSSLAASLASGTLQLVGIDLIAGQLISTITFCSGGTALSSGSNQWFALYSSARALLGVTNDATSAAWGSETAKTLTLALPYTVPTSGMYYLGACVVASTVPTLRGASTGSQITNLAPILTGASTASLTNPASAPATAAAITAAAGVPYAFVS